MWSLIEVPIEPRSKIDKEKFDVALNQLLADDSSLRVSLDPESGLSVLGGLSEMHLESTIDLLKRTCKVEANIGAPQVAYRETLGRTAKIDYAFKKHCGPMSQFARVQILFEPTAAGQGYSFESQIVDDAVPQEYIPGVEKGLESARDAGLVAGFQVVDFKATLVGGTYHDLDSSRWAFEIAARGAFRELREKGSPLLLEPVMKVQVVTPDEYLGDVIGTLRARRGTIVQAYKSPF